jgi:hypothetical protein
MEKRFYFKIEEKILENASKEDIKSFLKKNYQNFETDRILWPTEELDVDKEIYLSLKESGFSKLEMCSEDFQINHKKSVCIKRIA